MHLMGHISVTVTALPVMERRHRGESGIIIHESNVWHNLEMWKDPDADQTPAQNYVSLLIMNPRKAARQEKIQTTNMNELKVTNLGVAQQRPDWQDQT